MVVKNNDNINIKISLNSYYACPSLKKLRVGIYQLKILIPQFLTHKSAGLLPSFTLLFSTLSFTLKTNTIHEFQTHLARKYTRSTFSQSIQKQYARGTASPKHKQCKCRTNLFSERKQAILFFGPILFRHIISHCLIHFQ